MAVFFYLEVLDVVELNVMSMEQRVREIQEPFEKANFIKTRVPYVVVNVEIKHNDNVIKSEYTFYDADDMSFNDARKRIIDMLANGLTD